MVLSLIVGILRILTFCGVCCGGIACGIEGVPLFVAELVAQGHCTTWVGIALHRSDETGDTFAGPSECWLETGDTFARGKCWFFGC